LSSYNQKVNLDGKAAVDYIIKNNIDGDLVECGVQDAKQQLLWISKLLESHITDKKIWLFDTFTGLTAPSEKDFSHEESSLNWDHHTVFQTWKNHDKITHNTWCYSSLDEVKLRIESTNYPTENVKYVAGDVRQTLLDEKNIPEKISILRLDTDWYDSTKIELETLYPKLSKGGLLIIDDYFWWKGQQLAVKEYFKRFDIAIDVKKQSQHTGVYIKV